MRSINNSKLLFPSEKLKFFLLEKAAWISFFLIFIFVLAGFLFFYFKAFLVTDSLPAITQIQLPFDQELWRTILNDVNQRRSVKSQVEVMRDIFR